MTIQEEAYPFGRDVLLVKVWQVEVVKHSHRKHNIDTHLRQEEVVLTTTVIADYEGCDWCGTALAEICFTHSN